MKIRIFPPGIAVVAGLAFSLCCATAESQHLWWKTERQPEATCLYGEITVLATHPAIYYCGANWHPGEPAGGYCGIQHNGPEERRTIFSIWDTAPKLHPRVTEADAKTIFSRFGGEGEGAHTHMLWGWQVGETFQFFVQKQPGNSPNTTDARYYIFDPRQKSWRHSTTIVSPNGDAKSRKSVASIGGGGLGSFLENFAGKDKATAKLAMYRLWLGPSVENMECLTRATGDGKWGQLHDAYFLAEGAEEQLTALFAGITQKYGVPVFGERGKQLAPISSKAMPSTIADALKKPSHARSVDGAGVPGRTSAADAKPDSTRWLNESDGTTVRWVKGTSWAEFDNETGKEQLAYKAEDGEKDFVALFCPKRNQHLRFFATHAALLKNGKWEWVANGHWLDGK